MKRKKFLKTVSLLSLGAISAPKILNAGVQSSTVEITDECVGCMACIGVTASEMIIEYDDDDYQYDWASGRFVWVSSNGKVASLAGDLDVYEEWEEYRDVCPVGAIRELG